MVDEIVREMSPQFGKLYSDVGRPSIAPERLLRSLLLQIFYSVRSERMLIEQLQYNLLFRWFVGMEMYEAVWNPRGVQQESGAFAERRHRGGIFPTGVGTCEAAHVGWNFHSGRHADRGLGRSEEFSAQGRPGQPAGCGSCLSASRSENHMANPQGAHR